jgi:hypothetical protein
MPIASPFYGEMTGAPRGTGPRRVGASPYVGGAIEEAAFTPTPTPTPTPEPEIDFTPLPRVEPPELPPEYYEDVGPPPGEDPYIGGGPPGYAIPPSPAPVTPDPVIPAPAVPDPMVPTPVVPAPVAPSPVTPGPVTPMPGVFDPNDPWKGYGSAEAFANETKKRIDKKLAGTEGVDWQWAYPVGGWGKAHKVPIGDVWA